MFLAQLSNQVHMICTRPVDFFSEAKYVLLVSHIYLKLILAQQIENSSNQKYRC